MSLKESITESYNRMRLFQYRSLFSHIKEKPGSLTATEAYAVDVINILGSPTVKQFSDFIGVSQPNASYKISCLMQKGYITKEMSEDDRREYHLGVTEKFREYYLASESHVDPAVRRLEEKYSPEQLELFCRMLSDLIGGIGD